VSGPAYRNMFVGTHDASWRDIVVRDQN
jgi:hypothetical protein